MITTQSWWESENSFSHQSAFSTHSIVWICFSKSPTWNPVDISTEESFSLTIMLTSPQKQFLNRVKVQHCGDRKMKVPCFKNYSFESCDCKTVVLFYRVKYSKATSHCLTVSNYFFTRKKQLTIIYIWILVGVLNTKDLCTTCLFFLGAIYL